MVIKCLDSKTLACLIHRIVNSERQRETERETDRETEGEETTKMVMDLMSNTKKCNV